MNEAASAFGALRVVDFGQYVAGPAVGVMFADLGSEVIEVTPPEGRRWASPAAKVLARGKKSLALDLKSAEGRRQARALIEDADLVIENFRPGVMARLGLGVDWALSANPRLIYLSLPGFAADDPEHADLAAYEAVIGAVSGQFTDMGLNRVLMGIDPSFSPLTLGSAYAALFGACAAMAALHGRERSGRGDHVEVPIAAALLEGLAYNAMHVEGYPERYKSLREREIERRKRAGEPLDCTWREAQAFCDPFYRVYRCADGRFFYPVAGSHLNHSVRILELLGLWGEFADDLRVFDAFLDSDQWPDPPGFTLSNYPVPKDWADRLASRMGAVFAREPAQEWERRFAEARLPGAMVRTTKEWLASDHARQSGLLATIEDPDLGALSGAGRLAWFADRPDPAGYPRAAEPIAAAPAPRRSAEAVAAERDDAPPRPYLDGVKVLDLCNVLAGPQIACVLRRFGAEVIALGPIRSTMDPWNTVIYGLQVNQGKRSALADIESPLGRDVLERLLAWADVLTFNGTDRQLEKLGLAPERLRAINPGLVLLKLDCYGGPRPGPRGGEVGYDDTTQASTGVMSRFGGAETPEEHAHMGTIDVLGGIAGAFGAVAALYQRARGGEARYAKTSLAAAGQLLQIPFMHDHPGRAPFDEPSGRETRGDGPLYRNYRAADGFLFFAAGRAGPADLARIFGVDAGAQAPWFDEAALEVAFASREIAHWRRALGAIGAAAVPLGSLAALRARHVRDAGAAPAQGSTFRFVRWPDHPCGRAVTLVDEAAVRPRRAPLIAGAPAPKYGADSRAVLAEMGLGDAEIERAIAVGAVAETWSGRYMPR